MWNSVKKVNMHRHVGLSNLFIYGRMGGRIFHYILEGNINKSCRVYLKTLIVEFNFLAALVFINCKTKLCISSVAVSTE